jgi:hypothetical protein
MDYYVHQKRGVKIQKEDRKSFASIFKEFGHEPAIQVPMLLL